MANEQRRELPGAQLISPETRQSRAHQEIAADLELRDLGSILATGGAETSTGSPLLDAVSGFLDLIGDPLGAITGGPGLAAGLPKVFKAGPANLQGLIKQLAKTGEALPKRSALRPAIRVPTTGEVFASEPGGLHPIGTVQQVLTRRKTPVPGTLEFGFQVPGSEAFIPEQIAGQLQIGNAGAIERALERGTPIETLIDILKQGRLP